MWKKIIVGAWIRLLLLLQRFSWKLFLRYKKLWFCYKLFEQAGNSSETRSNKFNQFWSLTARNSEIRLKDHAGLLRTILGQKRLQFVIQRALIYLNPSCLSRTFSIQIWAVHFFCKKFLFHLEHLLSVSEK